MTVNPMLRSFGLCCLLSSGIAQAFPTASTTPQANSASVATRSEALDKLLTEQWQYQLKDTPELATTIGDDRYNDRWTDYSLAHVAVERAANERFLKRFQALDISGLSEQQQLSQKMMVRQLQDNLEAIRLKNYEMPLDQIEGIHLQIPELVSTIPFETIRNYEDYLKRLQALPKVLDDLAAASRQGLRDGLIQPRYLLEKVVIQLNQIASATGEANVFGQPVAHFPASISAADQQRLRKAILTAVDQRVRPAYRKLAQFVAKDYAPHGRTNEGLWALPDGDERYRFAIHMQTTTDLSPAQIHQIGLNEVTRIEADMSKIALSLGYKDLASFRAAVAINPKLRATSREQILDAYRHYIAGMQPELPKLFGHLPQTPLEVRATEPFREKDAAFAEYHQGTPDGSRPGIVFVNTSDYAQRNLYVIEDTAYHEGVPGHHLQIAVAMELDGLPLFRRFDICNAHAEGWALYAEKFPKELGFYQDPYADFGRLSMEAWRASRLVVDPGIHHDGWSRAQAIQFMTENTAESPLNIAIEVDRYFVFPGQATSYAIGLIEILRLRSEAETALGDRFDLREYHDLLLGSGSVPLPILRELVEDWVDLSSSRT